MATLSLLVLALVGGAAIWSVLSRNRDRTIAYEIAFTKSPKVNARSALYVVRSDGSGLRRVNSTGRVDTESPLLWTPGGDRIVYVRWLKQTGDIYSVNVRFSKVRRLTRLGGWNIIESLSPDGKWLLIRHADSSHGRHCYCCCESCSCYYYYLVNTAGKRSTRPLPRDWEVSPLTYGFTAWTSEGSLLVNVGEKEGFVLYRVERDRSIVKLVTQKRGSGTLTSSRDGHVLMTNSGNGARLMNSDGKMLGRVSGSDGSISPDGRFVAYECGSDRDSLCITKVGARGSRRILREEYGSIGYPVWSPDSRSIAVDVQYEYDNDPGSIVVVQADGSEHHTVPLKTILRKDRYPQFEEWSPDSKLIAFVLESRVGASTSLYVVSADGRGDPVRVSGNGKGGVDDFAWRPVPSSD